MNLHKLCPSCNCRNEASQKRCARCGFDLSTSEPAEEPTIFIRAGDILPTTEGLLVLCAPDGSEVTVKSGDIVGRTGVGAEVFGKCEEMSRRHAQFLLRDGAWFIKDLSSSNGTYVAGERISPLKEVPVRNGQSISLSPLFGVVLRISCEPQKTENPSADEGRKSMVVLFADLKGSVDFYQEKGTIVAKNWILKLYALLSKAVKSHSGTHVKNIGDAVLAVFDDPYNAGCAAVRMLSDLKEHNASVEEPERYLLRIGMDIGTVSFENNDVFGNAVNIASRVQAIAPPERIYITGRIYDLIAIRGGLNFRFIGSENLKGVKGPTDIYEISCSG